MSKKFKLNSLTKSFIYEEALQVIKMLCWWVVSILKIYNQKIPNHLKVGYNDNNDDLVVGDYQIFKSCIKEFEKKMVCCFKK
jgi:hypothetical protein